MFECRRIPDHVQGGSLPLSVQNCVRSCIASAGLSRMIVLCESVGISPVNRHELPEFISPSPLVSCAAHVRYLREIVLEQSLPQRVSRQVLLSRVNNWPL